MHPTARKILRYGTSLSTIEVSIYIYICSRFDNSFPYIDDAERDEWKATATGTHVDSIHLLSQIPIHNTYLMHSLKLPPTMKRRRPIPQPPSTPPTPTLLKTLVSNSKPTSNSSKKPRILIKTPQTPPPTTPISPKWVPLNIAKSELSLALTFPTGQTFRWKQTTPLQYTGVIGSHLISLKHLQNGDVAYLIHQSPSEENARSALLDFLNVGISLSEMWEVFKASDSRFAELAQYLGGARVLRQDPLECLIQFLCSSNNNIGRITKMVDFVSSLGNYLGSVGAFDFYEFPSLDRLSMVSEEDFREAGFGYRFNVLLLLSYCLS